MATDMDIDMDLDIPLMDENFGREVEIIPDVELSVSSGQVEMTGSTAN